MTGAPRFRRSGKCRTAIFREQIRLAGFSVVVLGAILALSSLFADQLALGMPGSGFGMKQLAGTIAGLLVAAGGMLVLHRFPPIDDEPDDEESGDQQT